jgi:DNA-binding MarR family transcriptional regulator
MDNNNNKIQGMGAIIAAGVVMFSAMWDPRVSVVVAVVALVGLGIWHLFLTKSEKEHSEILENLGMSGFTEKQQKEKEEYLQKILEILDLRDKIVNKDVEDILNVSDATATRYLDELEKEGKIMQVFTDGKYVYYKKL